MSTTHQPHVGKFRLSLSISPVTQEGDKLQFWSMISLKPSTCTNCISNSNRSEMFSSWPYSLINFTTVKVSKMNSPLQGHWVLGWTVSVTVIIYVAFLSKHFSIFFNAVVCYPLAFYLAETFVHFVFTQHCTPAGVLSTLFCFSWAGRGFDWQISPVARSVHCSRSHICSVVFQFLLVILIVFILRLALCTGYLFTSI